MQGKRTEPPRGWKAPSGRCECGCGRKTPICTHSRAAWGQINGFPVRYIHGHAQRGRRAFGWKGGRKVNALGYVFIWLPTHHMAANYGGYVPEHRLVWERAHHRRLPPGRHVHHLDGNPGNNAPENLVALTKAAHYTLHAASPITRRRKSAASTRRYTDAAERRRTGDAIRRAWKKRRAS